MIVSVGYPNACPIVMVRISIFLNLSNSIRFVQNKKTHENSWVLILSGGERGIRTPGPVTVNGFQDRRIRPLCHLSAAKVIQQF